MTIIPSFILEPAILGYVDAMQWANTMRNTDAGLEMEPNGCLWDPSPDALSEARSDVLDFLGGVWDTEEAQSYLDEFDAHSMGFDFALSRNGHGAGFFDRGQGFRELQKAARTYGSATWVVDESSDSLEVLE